MSLRIDYILPAHNAGSVLDGTVTAIVRRLDDHPGSRILIVENGSSDDTYAVAAAAAVRLGPGAVRLIPLRSNEGMGHAYRAGLARSSGDLVVLSAADLPFGFSDLDALLALPRRPAIAVGSKAHPESVVEVDRGRRVMSAGFRRLRMVVLGLSVGDSQGTILIDGGLARRLAPDLRCGGYLTSTEIIYLAQREGETPVELPVHYPRTDRPSTVSPLADSIRMAGGVVRMRLRRRRPAGNALRETS